MSAQCGICGRDYFHGSNDTLVHTDYIAEDHTATPQASLATLITEALSAARAEGAASSDGLEAALLRSTQAQVAVWRRLSQVAPEEMAR